MIAMQLRKAIDRYPTSDEIAKMSTYVSEVPDRAAALEELRKHKSAIVDEVCAAYEKLYPRFKQFHPHAWDKFRRDYEMMLCLCGNAMFVGETDTLREMWTRWFQTILKSLHFTPTFVRDLFVLWEKSMKRLLTPRSYELMLPAFEHIRDTLCDIPEPVRPEVGERRNR
jgi:hypothetical protein